MGHEGSIAAHIGHGDSALDQSIPAATVAEIEEALAQVAEIRAARIVSSDEGEIQGIPVPRPLLN